MARKSTRRGFMQRTALAGAGFWVAGNLRAEEPKSPNERIRFACIGVGGKGSSDSADAGNNGDVVAICDVDEITLNGVSQKFPDAKKYVDFRQMFDEMHGSIDAVTVSTPDHMHGPAALMAMRLGKHCFCQKPLTHSLHEARLMAQAAAEFKLATQMGNQGTANAPLRKAAAMIKAGAVGTPQEVHVWTNRPIWAQGGERPEPETPPSSIHWDLWLGAAPERPYAAGYHPFAWRGWWDFGTGALGDMACHTMNMPFMALNLRDPVAVEAEHSGHNKDSYPKWSVIKYSFPATDARPAVTMTWYDGGKLPPQELTDGREVQASGALIIGDKGKLYAPGDYAEKEIYLLGGATEPAVDIVTSPGHFDEWVRAIKGGEPAMSNFDNYAGPLTETVLLGNLAVWAGTRVEWDPKEQRAVNCPEVEPIIRPTYRAGYTL